MSLLIHATITVTGDDPPLAACAGRLRTLLAAEAFDGEYAEHHGAGALCYDFKVRGGIPFPAFAAASQEFPALRIAAEWIDVEAGARGAATLVNGKLEQHGVEPITTRAGDAHPCHVSVSAQGRLDLALTFHRLNRGEWAGYALTHARDALIRIVRAEDGDGIDLFATEGAPEWSLHWRGSLARDIFESVAVSVPQAIDRDIYRDLERLAQNFAAAWIWFAAGPREEIAIETERYARAGHAVSDANVRSARLHRIAPDAAGRREHTTLAPDETWIREVVARCWAPAPPAGSPG